MTQKKSLVASAVGLALLSMMSAGLNAGMINNSNNTSNYISGSLLGACGVNDAAPQACVGAWDMGNVTVKLFHADGTEFGIDTFDETDGTYETMILHDSFSSWIYDWDSPAVLMAKIGGKVWPVGEPAGIKAVVGDTKVNNGKPQNCLINTAYLGADGSSDGTHHYLNSASPEPVICSSGFQTHKRFKVVMQPATVDGVADGEVGKPIDLVFNVANSGGVQPYQVFSKINNYTGKRLKGYKIVVGTGKGEGFVSADAQGIEGKLFISLGVGEGASDPNPGDQVKESVADGSNLFDDDGGLASFAHGLFGAPDKHFTSTGFFDSRTAGFNVEQICSAGTCDQNREVYPGISVNLTDTIRSTTPLESNYVEGTVNFGDWLYSEIAPRGIFFDEDSDPYTDNDLVAYWNGSAWVKNFDSGFAIVSATELNTWAADERYSIGVIEDSLNLGINYIVNVGDDIPGGKVTIRIIPVVGDQTQPTPWMTALPATGDLLPVSTTTSSGGGGCAIGGNGRFDPTLPALLAAGLGFFGWRRFKAGK